MTIKVTTIAVIAIALIMSVRAAEDLSESVQVRLSKDFLINYFQEDDQYLLNLVQNIQIQDPSLEKAKGEISISVKPVGQFDKFNFDIVFQKPKTVIVTSNHCILHVEGASGSFSFELPIALLKYQTDLSGYIIDTPYNPDHKFEIKVEQAVVKNVKGITQDEAQSLANVMQSVLDKNTQNIMSKVYLWQDINADYTTKKAFAKLSSIIYLVAVTSKTIDGNQFLQLNGNPITEYFLTRNFTQIQKPTNWVEDPSAYNLQARLDDNFINSVLNLVIDIKGLVDIRYLLNLNGMPTDMLKVGTIAQAFGSLKDQYGEDAPFSVVFDFSENYLEKMLDWADGQPEKPTKRYDEYGYEIDEEDEEEEVKKESVEQTGLFFSRNGDITARLRIDGYMYVQNKDNEWDPVRTIQLTIEAKMNLDFNTTGKLNIYGSPTIRLVKLRILKGEEEQMMEQMLIGAVLIQQITLASQMQIPHVSLSHLHDFEHEEFSCLGFFLERFKFYPDNQFFSINTNVAKFTKIVDKDTCDMTFDQLINKPLNWIKKAALYSISYLYKIKADL